MIGICKNCQKETRGAFETGLCRHCFLFSGANKGQIKKGERRGISTEFKKGAKKSSAWYKAMKERIPWQLGKKLSKEHIKSLSESHKGKFLNEKHHAWKGDSVGNVALHSWVKRRMGKPKECVYCGRESKWIDWANIDHKYKRNLEDYIPLCRSCHRKYDLAGQKYNFI